MEDVIIVQFILRTYSDVGSVLRGFDNAPSQIAVWFSKDLNLRVGAMPMSRDAKCSPGLPTWRRFCAAHQTSSSFNGMISHLLAYPL